MLLNASLILPMLVGEQQVNFCKLCRGISTVSRLKSRCFDNNDDRPNPEPWASEALIQVTSEQASAALVE